MGKIIDMRSYNNITKYSTIRVNKSYEADPLHVKLAKVMQTNEPIDSTSPTIYTERKNGVNPAYDIRTDRFEIAIEAMDKITKSHIAQREKRIEDREKAKETKVIQMPETGSHTSDTGTTSN